jgi:Domain of unknown function (DUF6398)
MERKVKKSKTENIPKQMESIFKAIVTLTDEVCSKYLNDEYAQLARTATAALCRKRPSPLVNGSINAWACGIVYALGFVNFLFDKSQEIYLGAEDLCDAFGVSKSTGSAKSKMVRDALKMSQMDPNWCLPSKLDDNPLAWMLMVNGFMVDIRYMPLEVQEIAYRKGLIPYIPGERKSK